VAGAWNLHRCTQGVPLDHFVAFSSVVGILGSSGQSNYAAANACLDGLMRWRRQQGLAGTSVQWGAWAEVGMAVRVGAVAKFERLGYGSLRTHESLTCLEKVLRSGWPEVLTSFRPFILNACLLISKSRTYIVSNRIIFFMSSSIFFHSHFCCESRGKKKCDALRRSVYFLISFESVYSWFSGDLLPVSPLKPALLAHSVPTTRPLLQLLLQQPVATDLDLDQASF